MEMPPYQKSRRPFCWRVCRKF